MTNDTPPPGFDRVYHLAPLRFAKTNIEFRRLKVATFSDANNPFEAKALNLRGRRNREARKLLNEFKASQDEQTGMLCFSRAWTNPVSGAITLKVTRASVWVSTWRRICPNRWLTPIHF